MEGCLQKYSGFSASTNFVKNLQSDAARVCASKTCRFFTAGHVASQRADSNNNRIKQDWDLKKDLKTFHPLELSMHLFSICERQDVKSVDMITTLLQQNKHWSAYVDKLWKVNAEKMVGFVNYEKSDEGNWLAFHRDSSEPIHCIKCHDPNDEQSSAECNCPSFTSSLLPCPGICALYVKLGIYIFNKVVHHPRWRLENHPLMGQALSH